MRRTITLIFLLTVSVGVAQVYIGNGTTLHYSGGDFAPGVINNNNGGTFSMSADFAHNAFNYVDGPLLITEAGTYNVSIESGANMRNPVFTTTAATTIEYDTATPPTGTPPLGLTLADAELYTFTNTVSSAAADPLDSNTYGGQPHGGATVVPVFANTNGGTWSETLTPGSSTVMAFALISAETDILTYSFAGQTGPAIIDDTSHAVDIEVTNGTDVSALVATFTLSSGATAEVGATAQVSGTTPNDFSAAVTYTVTAADGTTTQDWAVTVTEETLGIDEAGFNAFSVYPNPIKVSDTYLNYTLPSNVNQLNIVLYDLVGKVVLKQTNVPVKAGVNSMPKPNVPKGIYLLEFSFNNGEKQPIKKLIME